MTPEKMLVEYEENLPKAVVQIALLLLFIVI